MSFDELIAAVESGQITAVDNPTPEDLAKIDAAYNRFVSKLSDAEVDRLVAIFAQRMQDADRRQTMLNLGGTLLGLIKAAV